MKKTKQYSLGKKIKLARRERGLSQREMADALNLSDKAISSYEVDRSEPTLGNLKEISKLTDKPLVYFLDDEIDIDAVVLRGKLMTIERELQAIKEILADK